MRFSIKTDWITSLQVCMNYYNNYNRKPLWIDETSRQFLAIPITFGLQKKLPNLSHFFNKTINGWWFQGGTHVERPWTDRNTIFQKNLSTSSVILLTNWKKTLHTMDNNDFTAKTQSESDYSATCTTSTKMSTKICQIRWYPWYRDIARHTPNLFWKMFTSIRANYCF